MRSKAGGGSEGAGALEIEFEDDETSPGSVDNPAWRPRDLRATTMITLAVVILGAALSATHRTGSSDAGQTNNPNIGNSVVLLTAPDYAAYMVTVSYQDSHLASLPQRRIAVDMRITPVPGARVSVLNYYVNENGVISHAASVPSGKPLPETGTNVELDLTVYDCAVVPIGESMSFVNVVADGPAGVTDRFTILGERYSADLARLLRVVCPSRASGQNPFTSSGRVSGP